MPPDTIDTHSPIGKRCLSRQRDKPLTSPSYALFYAPQLSCQGDALKEEKQLYRFLPLALKMLVRILEEMAQGNTVTLIPGPRGTDYTGGSRHVEHLPSVVDSASGEGKIEYRKIGTASPCSL